MTMMMTMISHHNHMEQSRTVINWFLCFPSVLLSVVIILLLTGIKDCTKIMSCFYNQIEI